MKKIALSIFLIGLFSSCRQVKMKDFPYSRGTVQYTYTTSSITGEEIFFVYLYVTEKNGKTYSWRVEVPDTVYWRAYNVSRGHIIDIPK